MSSMPLTPEEQRQTLLRQLAREAYRRGQFTLASGRQSEHYVNCKPVSLSGSGLALVSAAMLPLVEPDAVAVAVAVEWPGPFATHGTSFRGGKGPLPSAEETAEEEFVD